MQTININQQITKTTAKRQERMGGGKERERVRGKGRGEGEGKGMGAERQLGEQPNLTNKGLQGS